MKIQIINGPNINLLGKREPSIYGSVTFEDYLAELRKRYTDVEIDYFQSNIEGEMIDCIQQVGFDVDYSECGCLYAYFHCFAGCYSLCDVSGYRGAYLQCT